MHLCYAPLNVKGKEVCGDGDCHDREYRRICTGHLCRFRLRCDEQLHDLSLIHI